MQDVRVALVQLGWAGDRAAMQAAYRPLIAQAAGQGAQIVCLPEFSLSPYFAGVRDPQGMRWAEPLTDGDSARFFSEMARTHGVWVVGSLFEKAGDGAHYDTATVHAPDGALAGTTRKVHIPSGVGYHETDYFSGGSDYPVHDLGLIRLSAPTCYDQWFPEVARISAINGAHFIFYPTAIGSEPTDPDMDSMPMWQTVMQGHAIANGVYVAAANRIGTENGVTFYGSSFVCDPMGRILAQAGRDTTEVIVADLRADVLARWRGLFPLLHQRKPALYGGILNAYRDPASKPPWLALD